jgi:hypothetical protein
VIGCQFSLFPGRGRSASEKSGGSLFEPQEAVPFIGGAEKRQRKFYQRRGFKGNTKSGRAGAWRGFSPYSEDFSSEFFLNSLKPEAVGFQSEGKIADSGQGCGKRLDISRESSFLRQGMGIVYLDSGLRQNLQYLFFPFPGNAQADPAVGAEVAGDGDQLVGDSFRLY